MADLTLDTLKQKVSEVETKYRITKEEEEFFRTKAEEARVAREQLVGQASILNQLIQEVTDDGDTAVHDTNA